MRRVGASAPGKALLCGEYAVLGGAPAVVAAVDRRVSVSWSDAVEVMPPEAHATLDLACARLGPIEGTLTVDASALRADGAKLGLGSSAAAAAASAGAVFATHGQNLEDDEVKRELFGCAFRGHATIAPRGSGVDVAASVYGGFLRFTRVGDELPRVQPISAPPGLAIALIWTGRPARTSDLLDVVRALEDTEPAAHREIMDRLSEAARTFAHAFMDGIAAEVARAAAEYGHAMDTLGRTAGAPIVEERLRRTAELAGRFSGGAKPSGAGGGDVAIAFFPDDEASRRFTLACRAEGLHPIDVVWGAPGVSAS